MALGSLLMLSPIGESLGLSFLEALIDGARAVCVLCW